MKSAFDLLNYEDKSNFFIANSKIKDAKQGLFTRNYLYKNTPVVIYFGKKMTDDEIYDIYKSQPKLYKHINRFIRGTPNGFVINGLVVKEKKEIQKNGNILGVFVNDIARINCKPEEITEQILRNYAKTSSQCNVRVVETTDYPVYVANRRIKKGEELYVHYGVGYWLSFIGCDPEMISELNKKYDFNSMY